MPDIGRRYPTQLSGGQRQRVALARALAIEPRMLLLDEPFGALDARVRKELRAGLREIHDQTGLTTVFVTHDQDEAMELADLVVVMSHGPDRADRHAEGRPHPAGRPASSPSSSPPTRPPSGTDSRALAASSSIPDAAAWRYITAHQRLLDAGLGATATAAAPACSPSTNAENAIAA